MKIIGASLTHNDKTAGWLKDWLDENSKHINEWVIVDDCSTDETYSIIEEFAKTAKVKMHISKTDEPTFKTHENKIREMLWNNVKKVAKEGDIILVLDSDEILCPEFREKTEEIVKQHGDNFLFSFKKIEMWSKEHYRVDGLWSNYFIRMFPYKDKEWGYYDKGFHFPQVPSYTTKLPVYNTNIRIKHLSYYNPELRKSKAEFMLNNPQQKMDVTYFHLKTVPDSNILAKAYVAKPEDDKVLLAFFCANLNRISSKTMNFLKNMKYKKENIDILFFASGCNSYLYKQIRELEIDCNSFNFKIINYQEDYNKVIRYKNGILKNSFLKSCKDMENKDYDYIFLIDGIYNMTEKTIKDCTSTDKDIIFDASNRHLVALSNSALGKLLNEDMYLHNKNVDYNVGLLSLFANSDHFIWGINNGMTDCINMDLVHKKYKQKEEENNDC